MLSELVQDHKNVLNLLAEGFRECQKHIEVSMSSNTVFKQFLYSEINYCSTVSYTHSNIAGSCSSEALS